MSGAIDFPEYLDVDLSTNCGESSTSCRRGSRRNSSHHCQDLEGGGCDCNGNQARRRSSCTSIQKTEKMAAPPRPSIASITSLKQSLEKSLGLRNDELISGLVSNEELGEDYSISRVQEQSKRQVCKIISPKY